MKQQDIHKSLINIKQLFKSVEIADNIGEAMLKFQEQLADIFKYKKLPQDISIYEKI